MDLIYTNAKRVDQGVLSAYSFDLSFGADENDFEITLGMNEPRLEYGAFIYFEGSEYGGVVDGIGSVSNVKTITFYGRTWHGVLNSKVIQPDEGKDYFTISGDANIVLSRLIERLGLSALFVADENSAAINISAYQFKRYCKAYDGIKEMLASVGAKLKITWKDRFVQLSAVPISDYTDSPVDNDTVVLAVEHHEKKVNHLICLGKGELADRDVVHLYVDQFGRIGDIKHYTELDEITDVYDNNSVESVDDLRKNGIETLKELQNGDRAEISSSGTDKHVYDIGDIVSASDIKTNVTAVATVTQKIVKIKNGTVIVEYKTGS